MAELSLVKRKIRNSWADANANMMSSAMQIRAQIYSLQTQANALAQQIKDSEWSDEEEKSSADTILAFANHEAVEGIKMLLDGIKTEYNL